MWSQSVSAAERCGQRIYFLLSLVCQAALEQHATPSQFAHVLSISDVCEPKSMCEAESIMWMANNHLNLLLAVSHAAIPWPLSAPCGQQCTGCGCRGAVGHMTKQPLVSGVGVATIVAFLDLFITLLDLFITRFVFFLHWPWDSFGQSNQLLGLLWSWVMVKIRRHEVTRP